MRLAEYVERYNIDKTKLAQKLAINISTLYNYMFGRREIPLRIAAQIVEISEGKVGFYDLLIDEYESPDFKSAVEIL